MSIKERFYDTKWYYDNHSKTVKMKNRLILDAVYYIEDLEAQVRDLEAQVRDLKLTVEDADEEDWWC